MSMQSKNRVQRARNLRKKQTEAERPLWRILRNRQLMHYKFRRQYLIDVYIVDFVCLKKKLIIEVDGCQHLNNQEYDLNQTLFLNTLGFRVLRFWNNQVLTELKDVLNRIHTALTSDF